MTDHPIRIDKHVPLPADTRGRGRTKFPFRDMEVGDSFFVPTTGKAAHQTRSNVSSAASRSGKGSGRVFTTRDVTENGVRGTRVWRTE